MTFFTKQEQRFLLFLSVTFIIGLAIKFVRKNMAVPDEEWAVQRQQILADLQQKALQINREDSAVVQTPAYERITKESLTRTININAASLEELQILPRIGPATAQKIIAFREKNGPFSRIEDIQKVKNIGPKTFEKIKDLITVD
ncbi:ComEA family DNA-binding protein [candidate division KSB1 bacterium]|nr:ComEA family DNA-binding protein [candidate division KSB1 bacterium]RQW04043.1 MAG: ComEA family DNA-binding protein [candidate division KSB1 bacterium]